VLSEVEGWRGEAFLHHGEDDADAPEMKGGLRQDSLAREERLRDLLDYPYRPLVMPVVAVGKGDEEPGVGDALHGREKPLRDERSRAPRTEPASLRKACRLLAARAFSSWSRTILPCGTPAFRADSSSHSASSWLRRTVLV